METANFSDKAVAINSVKGADSMSKYNFKRIYNRKLPNGGATYNSAPFLITILDYGSGTDSLLGISANSNINDTATIADDITTSSAILIAETANFSDKVAAINSVSISDIGSSTDNIIIPPININITDNSIGTDSMNILPVLLDFLDTVTSNDNVAITNNVNISETANIKDLLTVISNLNVSDSGKANDDFVSIASAYFVIDSDNILNPLGVQVTRDNREEILPSVKNYTEKIPGKHGEQKFKSELKGKILELTVVTDEMETPEDKIRLKELYRKYLDPLNGERSLVFANDIERQYKVRYSGKIDIENYPTWLKFVIPFKMSSPFIQSSFENIQAGSGSIENKGDIETPIQIMITGSTTNPSLTFNGEKLSYNGTIKSGETLTIDTAKRTAKIGNTNVLDNWCKKFPMLKPKKSINVVMGNNIAIKWKARWL